MKSWKLDSQQRVCADSHLNVTFKHYGMTVRTLTLSYRQFLNLHDIVRDLEPLHNMRYYPLGQNIWLQYYNNNIQLYHCRRGIYFTFHKTSWRKYLKEIHHRVRSFLRHDSTTSYDRQHTPSHETLSQDRSDNITSTSSQQQIVSGETSNASGENEQWSKSPNLSKRNSTNSGRPFSFIGAVHALGTPTPLMEDMEVGERFNLNSDGGQYGDFCTIE